MRLRCLIGFHAPLAAVHTNQGLDFCTCRGCGCDLVRTGRSWRRIPRGFRLVWKPRGKRALAERLRHRSLVVRQPSRLGFRRPEGLLGLFGIALRVLLASHRRGWSVASRPGPALPRATQHLPAR